MSVEVLLFAVGVLAGACAHALFLEGLRWLRQVRVRREIQAWRDSAARRKKA